MSYRIPNGDQNHRVTVQALRSRIVLNSNRASIADVKELDAAHEAHIRAKTDFHVENSDRTMINLIGTWARLNRVMWSLEDKYGSTNAVR